jgi:hypothetical protein
MRAPRCIGLLRRSSLARGAWQAFLSLTLLAPFASQCEAGGTLAFHGDSYIAQGSQVQAPRVEDVEIFVELVGIPNIAKINELRLQIRRLDGIQNAKAEADDYFRYIIYDPVWARSALAEFYLILGHEAGHHFCGHSVAIVPQNPRERELEADRFGGASIKRFEVYHQRSFISEVLAAAARKYPENASVLHPSRRERIAALTQGYNEGSSCGGLVRVEQGGYSRGVR